MVTESNDDTRPSYIKRIEKINPEKQLSDALTKNLEKDFQTTENSILEY